MRNLLFIILLSMLVAGCWKNPYCDQTCENYFAPSNLTVSWTDYNDPVTVRNYFYPYNGTILQHHGDTIRLTGWWYFGDVTAGDNMTWYQKYPIEHFYLTSQSNHNGARKTVYLTAQGQEQEEIQKKINTNFSAYSQKQLYIEAFIEADPAGVCSECATYFPTLRVTQIDTIPLPQRN